jgi:Flp pilus assembly protein TadD
MGKMPHVLPPQERERLGPQRPGDATHRVATVYFDDGTSCLRQGRYEEAEFHLRESLRLRPDDPDTLNNLGTAAWLTGRSDEAEGYYRRAFELKPDDYSIVNNMGNSLWHQNALEEAARFYRRALELKPDSSETWMNLGVLLTDLTEFDDATACIQESLRLRPESHEAHDNLGATLARQGKLDEALACYSRALKLQPYYAESHRNRAFIWLARGDFERGWPEFEWRLACRRHVGANPDCPRWTGEDLKGRSILLHAEQGLGDTIQFIRFVDGIRQRNAGQVIVICPKPLVRLIARFPGIDFLTEEGNPVPPFDVHASLWSLPAILGTTLANLPAPRAYLSVGDELRGIWRARLTRALAAGDLNDLARFWEGELAGGPMVPAARTQPRPPGITKPDFGHAVKVGIVWQGNPKHRTDRLRSFRLQQLEPLGRVPGVRLISVQMEHGMDQLRELGERFCVTELASEALGSEDRRDFLDTAAILGHLDLVVTPDSAVAHLAGSLGVPVWVALPAMAEWRWMLDREDSPWYPSMRLFRQKIPGDWAGVFDRMARVLRESMDPDGNPQQRTLASIPEHG